MYIKDWKTYCRRFMYGKHNNIYKDICFVITVSFPYLYYESILDVASDSLVKLRYSMSTTIIDSKFLTKTVLSIPL